MKLLAKELLGCCCSLEQRHHGQLLYVRSGDAFKVRANAAKLSVNESVDKAKSTIEPCEQAILDFVMDRESDLGAVWPNLGEIDQSNYVEVSPNRFESELIDRIAIHRHEHCARIKAERTTKAEVHCFRRSHGRLCDHEKLSFVRLNTSEPGLGFGQRLTHMKRFFKEHK